MQLRRGKPSKWDFIAAVALLLFGAWLSLFSAYSSSFHDFLGGRFPVADGFDWLKDTLNVAGGFKSDYGSKRPLNIPFNVIFIWLGDRLASDPLAASLAIKRLIALASILLFTSIARLRLSTAASFVVGCLLISSLGSLPMPILGDLLGHALGYTLGTELTTFIVVVNAVSLLLLAGFNREAARPRTALISFCLGILLLATATLMRPGTILLNPLLLLLLAGWPLLQRERGVARSERLRGILLWALVGVLSLMLVRGAEVAMFRQLPTVCGSIGSNQVDTLMGMSVGGNYRDGGVLIRAMKGLPQCGKQANATIKQEAIRRIRNNPLPLLSVIRRNALAVAANFSFSLPPLLLLGLIISKPGNGSERTSGSDTRSSAAWLDPRLKELALISVAGSLAMAFFAIAFLGEAGWRPVIPYVIFPLIGYGVLAELLSRRIAALSSRRSSFSNPAGSSTAAEAARSRDAAVLHHPSIWQNVLAVLIAFALLLSAVLGVALIKIGALGYRGYGSVSGSIERPASWLQEWRTYNRISPSMDEMYSVSLDPRLQAEATSNASGSAAGTESRLCIRYKRLQLPWDFPYGRLSITPGRCSPEV